MPEITALRWHATPSPALELIDQRILPRLVRWRRYGPRAGAAAVAGAIGAMVVRGAPAIGVAATFGMVLEAARHRKAPLATALAALDEGARVLGASRPTAVNLSWALARVQQAVARHRGDSAQLYVVLERLARRSVRNSIENLLTFPCINILHGRGKLQLHGALFDVQTGVLEGL